MSMDLLPDEVIENVLLYLSPLNRLTSSLTCRRWARIVSSSHMLEDIRFSIRARTRMYHSSVPHATNVLIRSSRQYSSMGFDLVLFPERNSALWTKVGAHLLDLRFKSCSLTEDTFCEIFQHCPKMKTLAVTGYHRFRRQGSIAFDWTLELYLPKSPPAISLSSGFRLGLPQMPNLRALILEFCVVERQCFATICESCPDLEMLKVYDCGKLTDRDIINLRRLKKLKNLQLGHDGGLGELTFEGGVGSSALETLAVVSNSFTDVSLRNIATHHPHLRFVHFSDCDEITDAGLQRFLRSEPLLEKIELDNCTDLTDQSLEAISGAPLLRHLIVTGVRRCGPDAEAKFRERRPLVNAAIVR